MSNIRKLAVIGQSRTYYLTLPKDIVDELNWRKGQKLTVVRRGDSVVIKDWISKKQKSRKRQGT